MINHLVKYEDSVINSVQDNQRKPCGLPTDRPTDRPTLAKQHTPFSSKGGIKIYLTSVVCMKENIT
jgi:hypothetical protein